MVSKHSEFTLLSPITIFNKTVLSNNGYLLSYEEINELKGELQKLADLYEKEGVTTFDIIETNIDLKANRFKELLIPKSENSISYHKKGIVYLIKKSKSKLYKIGITRNISNRVSQLQSSSGEKMEVIFYHSDVENYSDVELSIHNFFKNRRVLGEWFQLNNSDIKVFRNWFNIMGYDKN